MSSSSTQLSDRVAIVTGGSRGLGRELAAELIRNGWSVVIDARDPRSLADAAAELASIAGSDRVRSIVGSVADPSHRRSLVDAGRGLGRIAAVVNNASVLGPSPQPALGEYPLSTLTEVYDTNVVAPLGLAQDALADLRASAGTIVNITSDAGAEAYAGWGGYGSSKAALEHWSRVMAVEEPAIRVIVFDPGDMRTQMHQEAFPNEDISDRPLPSTVAGPLRRLLESGAPSGRYTAAELAEVTR